MLILAVLILGMAQQRQPFDIMSFVKSPYGLMIGESLALIALSACILRTWSSKQHALISAHPCWLSMLSERLHIKLLTASLHACGELVKPITEQEHRQGGGVQSLASSPWSYCPC